MTTNAACSRIGRVLLFLVTASIGAEVLQACSCGGNSTPCTAALGTAAIFLGRVTVDSGEELGHGPATMVVEDVLKGIPPETRELQVETGARSSCYMRLRKDERYVIYGEFAPDGKAFRRHYCSHSFQLAGHEPLWQALQLTQKGGAQMLVGHVAITSRKFDLGAPTAGVRVVATLQENRGEKIRLETRTGNGGMFEFQNVPPGTYQITLSEDLIAESRFPREDPLVASSACGYQSISAFANGRVAGVIRNAEGTPVPEGTIVEAYIREFRNEFDSSPVSTAKTDSSGRYEISGIPAGDVLIAVNGQKYRDESAFPPAFYPGVSRREQAQVLTLGPAQRKSGIDLVLGKPREAATLLVEGSTLDGTPFTGFSASINDLAGVQRGLVESGKDNNVAKVKVFAGETAMIRCLTVRDLMIWEGLAGPITVVPGEQRVRVVLKVKQDLRQRPR